MKTGLKDHFGGDDWGSINSVSQAFVKLKKGTSPAQVNAQFPGLRKKYSKEKEEEKDDTKHMLQSLNDIAF